MWHLKTKLGTFWIVKDESKDQSFFLGCEDEDLGQYKTIDSVLDDIHKRETGYLEWDEQSTLKVPKALSEWEQGAPEYW